MQAADTQPPDGQRSAHGRRRSQPLSLGVATAGPTRSRTQVLLALLVPSRYRPPALGYCSLTQVLLALQVVCMRLLARRGVNVLDEHPAHLPKAQGRS